MLKKLTITGYKDDAYSEKVGSYEAMMNPAKYEHSYRIDYNTRNGAGSPGSSPKYEKTPGETVKFQLIFDATGVLQGASTDLPSEIKKFQDIVYEYNGDIHSPLFVELSWGTTLFKGRLTSMQVSYTLFKPDGTPLRAEVNVDFLEFLDEKTIAKLANRKSPDMTHLRVVLGGETLPQMCSEIYNDSSRYIEVAKANKLKHFRNIKPGTKLYFPPLAK